MNLLDAISRQARANPQREALVAGAGSLSYRQLWHTVARTAWHLREQGVQQGDCVAISRMGNQAELVLVLALARLGAVSTVVQNGWPAEKRAQVFLRNGVSWWARDGNSRESLAGVPGLRAIAAQQLFAPVEAGTQMPGVAQGLADKTWRITLSSGTTGDSKSIPWTHAQAAALQRASLDVYPSGPGERLLVFADLSTGLGLGHALMQLGGGGTVILSDSIAPADFFQAVERHQPTRALTTTAIAFTLLAHAQASPPAAAPSPLISMLLGGSAVPPSLREGLQEKVCPNLMVTYGSTETGTLARADNHSLLSNPDCAGRVMPWIEAQAVDEQDQPLAPGSHGRLRFRSPAMATRYLGNPQATAEAFRGGWYYPGDVGAIDAEGYLTLGGRADDVINLQGVKVNPAKVEEALNSHPAVNESAVVAVDRGNGRLVLAAVVVPKDEFDSEALRAHVHARLGRLQVPAFVVKAPSLPKNQGGKLRRHQIADTVKRALRDAPGERAGELPDFPD